MKIRVNPYESIHQKPDDLHLHYLHFLKRYLHSVVLSLIPYANLINDFEFEFDIL